MATKYSVDYRQVNIGTGDCSFILLLEQEDGKDPVIKYSVLVDGGDKFDMGVGHIKQTMKRIADKYKPKDGFKLDAMVISHWDSDHCGGILRLLENDLAASRSSRVTFLKYNATTGDPESILYSPYPEPNPSKYKGRVDYTPTPITSTGFFWLVDTPPKNKTAPGRLRICKYLADMSEKDEGSLKANPKALKGGDESELIGRNLFTNARPDLDSKVVEATNSTKLVEAHSATMPGLYCVAANNRFLKGEKTSGKRRLGDRSETNRSSIVCMVIGKDGTMSHYLAGDAAQDLEAKIIDWTGLELATTASKPPTPGERVAIVKASHHGGAESTPITMCQTYKPKFFIFSAGNMHRHPAWETLLYVHSYYISPLGFTIDTSDKAGMYMTRYPYWLDKVDSNELVPDSNSLDNPLSGTSKVAEEYRETISSFFGSQADDNNLIERFQADELAGKITPSGVDINEWIRYRVEDVILPSSSFITKDYDVPKARRARALRPKILNICFRSEDDAHEVEIEEIDPNPRKPIATVKRSGTPVTIHDTPTKKKKRSLFRRPSAENDTDKQFYLMSSIVDPSSSDRTVYVPAPWDEFVSTLSYGFITLVDRLDSTSRTVGLHAGDEWQVWLSSAVSPASGDSQVQISVTGSVTNNTLTIDYFGLTISVPKPSSKSALDLTFSPARKVGPKSDPKFESMTDFLRFDIADSSLESISFGDLYKFFNVNGDNVVFASDIVFELDKTSAIWFSPLVGNYTSALRLQASGAFKPEQGPETVAFLKSLSDLGLWDELTPSTVTAVVKNTTTTGYFDSPRQNINNTEIILSFDFPSFSTTISFGTSLYTLVISWKEGALNAIVKVLNKVTNSSTVSDGFKDVLDKISSSFDILRVLVEIHPGNNGSKPSLNKIGIDAQLKFKIGKASSEKKDVIVMLSFAWPDLFFHGSLYVPDTLDHDWRKLLPSYEELLEVKPTVKPSDIASNLSLLDLIPGVAITTPPQGIPIIISSAEIQVNSDSFILQGTLNAVPPSPSGSVPSVSFDSLDLSLSFDWNTKTPSLFIAAVVNLHPPPAGSTDPSKKPEYMGSPGFLFASVEYADKKWTLTGMLDNINFGDLIVFFGADEKSQVIDVLGNVTIRSLFVNCEYGGKGEPTKFQFDGSIVIAALEMDFAYNRDSTGWSIEGALSAAKECTVVDIIHSICGDDSNDFDIPDFIGNIKLNVQNDPESHKVPKDSPVYLNCSKPSSKDSPLVFVFRLTLGKIQLSFIQISSQQSANSADGPAKQTKKRILMFTLGDFLPSFTIPVVGQLDNPVDGLEFVWVQDASKTAGLTRAEVVEINSAAFAPQAGIIFKELKTSDGAAQADIVLTAGCHFMLLVKDSGKVTAALDYKFGTPKKQKETDIIEGAVSAAETAGSDPPADSDGGVSKAAVHKTVGPLSVSNIGLQYKNSTIFVILDATLALGPIELSLLGFGLGVKLTSTLFSSFELPDVSIQLRGLAVALDKPPNIVVAGLFEDLSTPQMDLFAGGIAVSFEAYSFLALGSYGVVNTSSGNFKTFFVFAQLHGPLVELEFATINGVSLGFGFNSHVQYPSIDDILSFPLVKGISTESVDAASSSSNVLSILSDDTFTKWVTPQNDSFWFAVGLEVLAFEVLDVRAVAIIEVDPYVSLGLFANAVCSLPPMAPRAECFTYIELGITCRVDMRYGNFSVEGKLSPNSFVLHPSCHLLGGFALYYWFNPSPYAGEFVYTVGGYHPSYRPPSYYPQPQRLTITWKLDNNVSITGEAFFAVTPKVCMGGGSLSILFQAGPIRAYLDAYASFLMVWNPFHFMGDIGVSVGVGFHAKILFITINIEAHISASLHLEGPPFGGNVHVDFWLFGFDIHFGSHPNPPPALSLEEFWTLLSRSSNKLNTGYDAGITLVVESGYVQGKSKEVTPEPGQPWIVTAGGFKFNIQCRFALHTVKYNSESNWRDVPLDPKVPIYSKPMHTTESIESILKITILDTETSQDVGGFMFRPLTKNVPSAMWGQYDSSNDPSHGATSNDLLDGNNSTIKDVLMGVHVIAPAPEYPDDHIPPFNAHDAMFVEITKDERFPAEDPSHQSTAWLPKTPAGDEKDPRVWKDAKNAWSSPAEIARMASTEWGKVFGWVDKLVGSPPALLVDKFEEVYLSVPRITSA